MPPGRSRLSCPTRWTQRQKVDEVLPSWTSCLTAGGTNVLPDGKEVWFLLDTGNWDYRASCVCFGEDLNQLVLDTGRLVTAGAEPSDNFDFMPRRPPKSSILPSSVPRCEGYSSSRQGGWIRSPPDKADYWWVRCQQSFPERRRRWARFT